MASSDAHGAWRAIDGWVEGEGFPLVGFCGRCLLSESALDPLGHELCTDPEGRTTGFEDVDGDLVADVSGTRVTVRVLPYDEYARLVQSRGRSVSLVEHQVVELRPNDMALHGARLRPLERLCGRDLDADGLERGDETSRRHHTGR